MYTQLITIFFKNHLKPFLLNMKKILAIKWPMSITKMLRYGYRAFKPTAFYSLNIMLIILLSAIWSDLTLNESEVTSSVSTDDIYYLPDMVRMEMAEALDATAACTYDPQTLVIGDGSCSYPPGSQVYKLDEAFEESGSKIVYIKVCGYACCGTVLVNPKAGADCHLLEIAGPRGTGISVTEIGYVTSGMCWINTCAGSDEVMTYCSDGGIESRVTFLGSSDAGDGCSYWYYNFESKVDGCGRAISHMAFALNDFSECCPCTDIELDGPDEKDYGCQTTFDLDAAIQDLIDNGEVYATPFGDGCSANDITYDKASITGDECGYQVVVTYKVEAECGGFDATHEVVFKWKKDLTPPVLSGIPAGGDLGCNPTRPSCDAGVTANDNCDGSVAVTCTPGAITGSPCGYSQTFTYSAEDACGNPVSETVTYTWKEDLTPPVLSGIPAGGDLGCNPTRPSCDAGVTANDNCDGSVAVTCTPGAITGTACNSYSQTFTYSAMDACGNPVSETVTYTWKEDLTPPVLSGLPAGGDLGCNPTRPSCDTGVTANDNCDGEVAVVCTAGQINIDGCKFSQTFTYSAEDACGNPVSETVTYTWKEDLTPPVLSGIPAGGDLGCNPTRPSCDAGVTANDNCDGSVAVTCTPGAITGTACNGYSQTFTYSAEDACGNPVSETVTYTWKEDLTPPVLSGLPAGGDLGCNPTRPSCDTGVTANDNCDGEVAVVCTAGQINIDGCKFSQTFTYSAVDVCGNPVNKMVNYTWIEVDLTCSITVDEDDDCGGTTVTLVASATADCGDLPPGYSFGYEWSTGETTPGITVGAGNYEVTVYIIDPAGNRTECYCTETYTITEECGTSWARARDGSSICNNTFGCASPNWGWTTQLTPGTHEFDLLEGAPSECNGNGSTGDLVGYATVTWDGTSKPVVDLHIDDGEHYATSWHIHVSCNNPLPVARNGKCSAAPGQFGCSDNEVGTDFYDILAGCFQNIDFDGCESIWISIHAVTCDLVCNETLADVSSKNDLFDVDFGNSFKELQNTDIEKTGINLTVFPNPVSRDLYLDIQGLESETLTIQLFDTFGRMVKETKLDYLAKERIHYVLPDQIADGMYYLKLIDKTPVKTIPIMVYQR
jgi:hypothetical protein